MGVRILHGQCSAVLYCSTTDWAFGPVFGDTDTHDAEERAELFCEWLHENYHVDPRALEDSALESKYVEFCRLEDELWKKKEELEDVG
jgi:hypothetical protein